MTTFVLITVTALAVVLAAERRVLAEREARPNWAESSVTLRHLRDADGPGGVQRSLWEAS